MIYVIEIYPTQETDDDSDIISTKGDKMDIQVDDENSVKFFIGVWVLVIYEGNCYPGEIKSLKSNEYEVLVMHPSRKYWKWPNQEDKIYCLKNNVLKNITHLKLSSCEYISCLKNCNSYDIIMIYIIYIGDCLMIFKMTVKRILY